MIATANGHALERAVLSIPRWGVWHLEIGTVGEVSLEGGVSVSAGRLTLEGTVAEGGPRKGTGRASYRVAGGGGGWGKSAPAMGYRSGLGVKRSTIAKDAASVAGEKLAPFVDSRVGPAFAIPAGHASDALDEIAPETWYVDEAGVTHLEARGSSVYSSPFVVLEERKATRAAVIVAEDLRGLVPGAQITLPSGPFTIGSVRHEITSDGIRSILWGLDESLGDRAWNAIARIVRKVIRPTFFHGAYEYKVVSTSGGYLDLEPVDRSLGLPSLANVIARVGAPGALVDVAAGSLVAVGFMNGAATRPYVASYEGPEGGGFLPTTAGLDAIGDVKLGGATARPIRSGDKVFIPGVQPGPGVTGVILQLDPSVVLPGPGPVGFSRVKA